VPAWSVCVGSTRVRTFPGGEFGMPCVLVLRRLEEGSAHEKLALNEILRDHGVSG
jgi:2,3,4,5-tetrahydropyridine-2,6-dicarboxylate N-succinyltransferase